jgi:CheY-like chemotaxis protein
LSIDENNPENAQVTVNSGLLQEITKNIIKEITKKDLTVEFSQPNRFTFKFEFPISTVSLTEQDEEIPEEGFKMYPRPPLNITKDSIVKVLVVDDIPINLQIAKSLLNGIKVECVGVLSGQEAIDLLLQKTTSTPELKVILMDCMMPDMDGWQTSSKIHELYNQKILKHLPYIIGHSAFENKQDIAKCFESGMDDFLAKPSPTSEYFNKVSRWLAEPFRLD